MMSRSASYHEELIKDLKDPLEAACYIEAVLEEGDSKMLGKALNNVIEAQGGIDRLSLQVKQCYEKLDQNFFETEEIDFYSLMTLLNALGLQLSVTVKSV
jgi:DNA-binding phage protein